MKSPSDGQEYTPVLGNGLLPIENVLKRRDGNLRRVRSLDRLLELLRVAYQNKILCRARDSKYVGQTHLSSLINK